jgi:8-oxo-dGTP pyrophosphatase MutT (NUDIX family)
LKPWQPSLVWITGAAEKKETIGDAAKRELFEEISIMAEDII